MNQHDRSNLEFLLQSERISDWMLTATPDDIDYARGLLDEYSRELVISTVMLTVEPKDEEYLEASILINRIKESSRSS